MKDREIATTDLSLAEQERVVSALHYLHVQFRQWKVLAKVLHFDETTLVHVAHQRRSVSVLMAFRIARVAKVTMEDLLKGKFPEAGSCPRCGYKMPVAS
jgi:hypothetical protein